MRIEGSPIWPFNFFIMKKASAVLGTMLPLKHKAHTSISRIGKNPTLSTNPEVFNYFLCTNATDNIADIEVKITMVTQPSNKSRSQHAEEMGSKGTPMRRYVQETWSERDAHDRIRNVYSTKHEEVTGLT